MQTTTASQDFLSLSGLTIERLSQIRKPVLAMYGQNSPTIVSMYGLQAYLPECETAIVEGAGHFFPLTKPRIFIELVTRFLNELEEVRKC
jgi:pimeloyl-ACP methyl ester carboxylesterase